MNSNRQAHFKYLKKNSVFFKKVEMHCLGGPFDECTVKVEILINLGKTKEFCQKSLSFLLWKGWKFEENAL